jgi:hypothetical protein
LKSAAPEWRLVLASPQKQYTLRDATQIEPALDGLVFQYHLRTTPM